MVSGPQPCRCQVRCPRPAHSTLPGQVGLAVTLGLAVFGEFTVAFAVEAERLPAEVVVGLGEATCWWPQVPGSLADWGPTRQEGMLGRTSFSRSL